MDDKRLYCAIVAHNQESPRLKNQYDAASIEVLTGLEPVKKRPGMYTDTTRPNHLAQEVIDNSVDEAIAGHATQIGVILHADQSLSVIDNGRGMPVDKHPEQKIPGVEVILTKLHAGGKFSNKNYQFSGRPARRRRVGGQRPVEASSMCACAATARNTPSASTTARRPAS